MEKEKVFCSNCRYMGPFYSWDCRHPDNQHIEDGWERKGMNNRVKVMPDVLNKGNDCGLYKRVWWMFWVKP